MAWKEQRKFQPGEMLHTARDVLDAVEKGCWIYNQGRPFHPEIVASWSLRLIRTKAENGMLRLAVERKAPAARRKAGTA